MSSTIDKRRRRYIKDYEQDKEKYKDFSAYVLKMIKDELNAKQIAVAYSSAREKDLKSLERKCQKTIKNENGVLVDKYTDFRSQIMDLAGVRIVTYLLEDIPEVSTIVKELFEVIAEHSEDKLDLLGADRIGYLSVHYIVQLKEEKLTATEAIYSGFRCEIQIRTVLQDAWAQIFHDRQYKTGLSIGVPSKLLRRTNLLAGNLESLDYEINSLVGEYDRINQVNKLKKLKLLLDDCISKESLLTYIEITFGKKVVFYNYNRIKHLLDKFSIRSIRALDVALQRTHCKEELLNYRGLLTADKIISYILIIFNSRKFFQEVGDNVIISVGTYNFLKGFIDIDTVCKTYAVQIENEEEQPE